MSEPRNGVVTSDRGAVAWERSISVAFHDLVVDSGALGISTDDALDRLRTLATDEATRLGVSLVDPAVRRVIATDKAESTRRFRDLLENPGMFGGRLADPAWRVSLAVGKVRKSLAFMTREDFEEWIEARNRNVARVIAARDRDARRVQHVIAAMGAGHYRTFGDAWAAGGIDPLALDAEDDAEDD